MAKIDLNDYLEKLTEPEDRETVANRAYQRELFEQYVTKDGNFPEQRAQLLEDFRVGKELTGPKGLRRKLGAFDLEYFGRAYLAHYFVRPSPKFHGELDRIWREGVLKGMNPVPFPNSAEVSEKSVPVSCMPSPESPEKRITTSCNSRTFVCSMILISD